MIYVCVCQGEIYLCITCRCTLLYVMVYTEGRYSYNIQIAHEGSRSLLCSIITRLVGEGIWTG